MQPHVALAILGATVIAIPAKHEDVTHIQVQFDAGSIFASGVQYQLCARHHSTDTSKQHVVSKIVFSVLPPGSERLSIAISRKRPGEYLFLRP